MTDEQFERLMKDAAETWRRPPRAPHDEMWAEIEHEAFGPQIMPRSRMNLLSSPWLRMAAVLVVGVAIGRVSMPSTSSAITAPTVATVAAAGDQNDDTRDLTTERYLDQTVALMVNLPKHLQSGKTDPAFVAEANESLTTLRLLMDSPAANNPRMRALFDDLELVLVQIVQMPRNGSASEAKLIRQAMQDRDVMPRLRDAVADNPN